MVVAVSELLLDPEGPMAYGTLDAGPVPMLPLVEPPEIEHVLNVARTRIESAQVEADYVSEAGEPAGAILREARERSAGSSWWARPTTAASGAGSAPMSPRRSRRPPGAR